MSMRYSLVAAVLAVFALAPAGAQTADAQRAAMLARAKAAELPGTWAPPPGDIRVHQTAGYANLHCSQVFVSGFDPDFARTTMGDRNVLAPIEARVLAEPPVVDRGKREVLVTLKGGPTRVARQVGSQGCVTLPLETGALAFTPKIVRPNLGPADAMDWPMGDRNAVDAAPAGVDSARISKAVEAAFAPAGLTQAFVVAHKGRIIAERYDLGATASTPLEGWSMGKSVIATLLGRLMAEGVYSLDQPAPVPEWQQPGDPRKDIRIRDILNMASGLRIRAEQDPDYADDGRYPDHWYYYTGNDAFAYAAGRQPQWPPATIGRYRNTDPVLASYLVRLAVEKRGEDYLSFPQRALFDPLGIRTATLQTDAHGNFLTQGYEQMSARDWTRIGLLYAQGGQWGGRQFLTPGFVDFVRTVPPAWAQDGRPIYGGFFWVNGDGGFPAPEDAYYMAGAGGQYVLIVPSHDLVITRLGRFAGSGPGLIALRKAVADVMAAVPPAR
jgi:CubicO group peptidase (beta-lactamase class C family)